MIEGWDIPEEELEALTGMNFFEFEEWSETGRTFSEQVRSGSQNPNATVCPHCGERGTTALTPGQFSFSCKGCGWEIAGSMPKQEQSK